MSERKEEVPMIPKHQAQAQMMHMSWTIRWLIIGIIIGFVCMVIQAYIFVTNYTSRTESWINTYQQLCAQLANTGVAYEENKTGDLQQLSLPPVTPAA